MAKSQVFHFFQFTYLVVSCYVDVSNPPAEDGRYHDHLFLFAEI